VPRPRNETVLRTALVGGALLVAWAVANAQLPHGVPSAIVLLGLMFGAGNALFAVGLVLVYKATRVINFAQGALGAFAAVLAFELMEVSGWPWGIAVPLSVVAAVAASALLELAFLRRLKDAPRTIVTVATIGIAQVMTFLQLVLQPLFEHASDHGVTAIGARFPTPFGGTVFTLSRLPFNGNHVLILVAVPLVLLGLARFLSRTWTGMGIRAVAENADRAAMLGWPAPRLSTVVWAIAGLLSGLSAVLTAPVSSFAVSASVGPSLILHGLAAAAIGRMRSIPVTLGASLALGVVEQVIYFNYSRSGPMDGLLLLVILVAFLAQSRELGRSTWQDVSSWRAVREIRPVPVELRHLPRVRAARGLGGVALGGAALLAPTYLDLSGVRLLSVVFVYAMVGVSLVVLTGWAGQISMGQWAIVGVGAYASAWLTNHSHLSFIVVLAFGGAAGSVVCVLLGLPALRIRGIFAGITTLAFAIAAGSWFFTFGWLEPSRLVPRPRTSWFSLESESRFYYVVLAALLLSILIGRNLRASRAGRLLVAVRDNENNAAAFGVAGVRVKLWAFTVSGFIAGLAGGVYALLIQRVEPASFPPITSLFIFAIVVIGGLGSVTGAVLGAFYVQGTQYFLPGWAQFLATGVGMLLLLMMVPGGLSQIAFDARDRALRRIAEPRERLTLAVDSAAG